MTEFVELVAATNFSFLDGASDPGVMVARAVELGLSGIGIADRNTVAGVVRAYQALRKAQAGLLGANLPAIDFRLLVGARLVFADGTPDIVVYPSTRAGWGRLTRLLTIGNRRAPKGGCILGFGDLIALYQDMMLIVLPESSTRDTTSVTNIELPHCQTRQLPETLAALKRVSKGDVWLGITMPRLGRDRRLFLQLAAIADAAGVPVLATCDALYAYPDDHALHDIVTCIREGLTIQHAGRMLAANGERHLKDAREMTRLFADRPNTIGQSVRLMKKIVFTLDDLRYEYPDEPVPAGWEAQDWLEHIVWQGAIDKYNCYVPEKLLALLNEEFALVRKRNYARYFLTVYDIVRFARNVNPPILCQGRGSAANSVICYVLGITSVDPLHFDMLFSRFVSSERDEPPDIDIDFEHERREEVIQYIYGRYGRDRAAIAGTVIHYRPRSTVREVGKALGLSEDVTQAITSTVWGSFSTCLEEKRFKETGFDTNNIEISRLRDIVDRLLEFPRHLSQHVGGFVLTQGRLDEIVPIHNGAMPDRTFIEWDKDDIDCLGIMKIDILALGMLTCIRKSLEMMRTHGLGDYALDTIATAEHPAVYDMLCKGDSIGVFQVESRAQINMLPRLKPREFYDLVVQVAIVRPGPIQGDMVHPYLRRRSGKELVKFPSPDPRFGPPDELHKMLRFTYGVPLFQEQAMKLAIIAAEFTPDEANQLRRSMATFRKVGGMEDFKQKLVKGMVQRGYTREFAERCYDQIEGFGSYGFPESHALSFARLVYVSSWIKHFQPAVFTCALLNSQPMGFYAPAQLVQDAVAHGVEVRPIDLNASKWDNCLEPDANGTHAIRLGFRQIDGFREDWAAIIASNAPFASVEMAACHLPPQAMRLLANADALHSITRDQRRAAWDVRRIPPRQLALFAAADAPELGDEPDAALPPIPLSEQVVADYEMTRLSLKGHPMAFLRDAFEAEGIVSCNQAGTLKDGRRVRVAGIVLVRQRPGNGKAIFVTIEDETGIANGLLWARDFEEHRRAVMSARLLVLEGTIQRSDEGVVHLMTKHAYDRSAMLSLLSQDHHTDPVLARADEFVQVQHPRSRDPRHAVQHSHYSHPRDVRILPKSRDFH